MAKPVRGPQASHRGRLLRPRSERQRTSGSFDSASVSEAPPSQESALAAESELDSEDRALDETFGTLPRSSETRPVSVEATPLSASVSFDEEPAPSVPPPSQRVVAILPPAEPAPDVVASPLVADEAPKPVELPRVEEK